MCGVEGITISSPDPNSHKVEGLGTSTYFIGRVPSAVLFFFWQTNQKTALDYDNLHVKMCRWSMLKREHVNFLIL